jgi:hypothetical protein
VTSPERPGINDQLNVMLKTPGIQRMYLTDHDVFGEAFWKSIIFESGLVPALFVAVTVNL